MSEALGETLFQPCYEPSGLAPPAPLEVCVWAGSRGRDMRLSHTWHVPEDGRDVSAGRLVRGRVPRGHARKVVPLERQSGRSQHTFASYSRGLGEGMDYRGGMD